MVKAHEFTAEEYSELVEEKMKEEEDEPRKTE